MGSQGVHGVTKSQTGPNNFTFSLLSHQRRKAEIGGLLICLCKLCVAPSRLSAWLGQN